MSTKIYNAFLYKGSIDKLMAYIQKYRKTWQEYQINKFVKILSDVADRTKSNLFVDGKLSFDRLEDAIRKDSEKDYKTWGDIFDVTASIAVYFHKGKIYYQTFLNDQKAPAFKPTGSVEYHYQNQSDPYFAFKKCSPEKMKSLEKDWKERAKVWNAIFDKHHSPSEAGLIHEFVNSMEYFTIALEVTRRINKMDKQSATEPKTDA